MRIKDEEKLFFAEIGKNLIMDSSLDTIFLVNLIHGLKVSSITGKKIVYVELGTKITDMADAISASSKYRNRYCGVPGRS